MSICILLADQPWWEAWTSSREVFLRNKDRRLRVDTPLSRLADINIFYPHFLFKTALRTIQFMKFKKLMINTNFIPFIHSHRKMARQQIDQRLLLQSVIGGLMLWQGMTNGGADS